MTENDFLDPAKTMAAYKRQQAEIQAAHQTLSELRFQTQFPDYASLVGQKDPLTGQLRPSELLQEALNEDSSLGARILRSADPRSAAYEVALKQKQVRTLRMSQVTEAQKLQQQQQAQAAARNAANTAAALTAPMSPASVSGVTPQGTEKNWDAALSDPAVRQQLESYLDEIRSGKHG